MTAQIAEVFRIDDEEHAMCAEPLGMFFRMGGKNPGFSANCTALWRGYVGEWEVVDDRLYLVKLNGELKDDSVASIESVFPGYPDRVFAHWFSGTIRVPQGKLLEYVHMGFESTYERDLILEFEKGVLQQSRVQENGVAASADAPEGYAISGATVFPKADRSESQE